MTENYLQQVNITAKTIRNCIVNIPLKNKNYIHFLLHPQILENGSWFLGKQKTKQNKNLQLYNAPNEIVTYGIKKLFWSLFLELLHFCQIFQITISPFL